MKKLILFAIILFSVNCLKSQNYLQLFTPLEKEIKEAFATKNYTKLEAVLHQSVKLFNDSIPNQEKKYYISLQTNNYYNLACVYSLTKKKKEAIEYFSKAVEYGYSNYKHTTEDTDLDNIRTEKKFIELQKEMQKKYDYLTILKESGGYSVDDTTNYPQFKYEIIRNQRIQAVKQYFKLDSVAGNGDEMSKILNLMAWVHNTIKHDGSNMPYCERDAIDLYNYAKTTGEGMNCRALAIVLNECYLSMGFKSRFITCSPKDSLDTECHVINAVYSTTLNKWLWMDPSFNTYVTDDKGNYLGIDEVRDNVIYNRTVKICPNANWNGKPITKEEYIDNYMVKNLYWFSCPVNSFFNIESPYRSNQGQYVCLAPDGFKPKNGGFITHDPSYFWQKPQF